MNQKEVIEKIKKDCQNNDDIIAVYIFGSFINGNFTKHSDIDIALMLDSTVDKFTAFDLKLDLAISLEQKLGIEVDVIIFSEANLRLKQKIINGKLIIGKDNKQRVETESRTRRDYLDMKYFHEVYKEKIGKGIDNG